MNKQCRISCSSFVILFVFFCLPDELTAQEHVMEHVMDHAIDRAPIGVIGDHYLHEKGQFMVSARQIRVLMTGNRHGTDDLSDTKIIELSNPYQTGNMSTKLSVVPQDMTMNMTMIGTMYAPSDSVTLVGVAMFMSKSMDLNAYQSMRPMSGGTMTSRSQLGSFTTSSSDLSDISLSSLIRLYAGQSSRLHAQLGIQRSIGATDATSEMLMPHTHMNMRKTMILPYGMQIGDGSTSMISALTYVLRTDRWVYGGQLRSRNSIAKDVWRFGDTRSLTGWVQRELVRNTALSFRVTYRHQDAVNGRDPSIVAPVQTANPSNYGGTITELIVGLNQLLYILPGNHADRIGIEATYPVHQDLNGPQMKSGVSIQIGYQKTFN